MADRTIAQCISRREFTLAAAMAVLSGVAITVTGCGDSSSPTAPSSTGSGSTSASGDRTGAISANHGHAAVVAAAQLGASGGITLNIQGSASHPHSVSLTGADLSAIAGNQRVSKESSNDAAHTHTVTFN